MTDAYIANTIQRNNSILTQEKRQVDGVEYIWPLLSIIMINILLSGDNALVIALASRKLSPQQQKVAMLYGSAGAIGLRISLTFMTIFLLQIPYLRMVGGVLLLWISIKLIIEQKHHEHLVAKNNLWSAVRTIIVADVIMSLDNVIAIIGVAKGKMSLVMIGLVISIPMIIWGSKFISILIKKWPIIIGIGAVFLGWTAGEMVVDDGKVAEFLLDYSWKNWVIPSLFALIVIMSGRFYPSKKM